MIVGNNYIFVHNPKCAGQAIAASLLGANYIWAHIPLSQYPTKLPAFGFVRNPWDRMVSLYFFMCQKRMKEPHNKDYQVKIREMGFKKWLLTDKYVMDKDWSDVPMQRRSQMFWLDGCKYVGKFENLPEDLTKISKVMGFKIRPLISKNRSSHNMYQEYYDGVSKSFVAKHFDKEIKIFGYEF